MGKLRIIDEKTYPGTWRAVAVYGDVELSAAYGPDGLRVVRTNVDGMPKTVVENAVSAATDYAERRVGSLPREWHAENFRLSRRG